MRTFSLILLVLFSHLSYGAGGESGELSSVRVAGPILPPSASHNTSMLNKVTQLKRFSFGSCNKEFKEQVVWKPLLEDSPQLFIWGGDNVYGDRDPHRDNLAKKYEIQNAHPLYGEFRSKTPIIGIWDDHDFGLNDAGAEFPKKDANKTLLLDFLQVPKDADVRSRKGVYQTYKFGSVEKEVRFVLLDNRYNLTKTEILGEDQWAWLENILKHSKAKIHFIVGGLAIISPKVLNSTQWANFPSEQKRLIDLLRKYKTPGVVFLTGDKHFSGVTERFGFVEIMSSGMTHTKKGFLVRNALKLLYKRTFFKRSYATIDIDWDSNPLRFKLKYQGRKSKKEADFKLGDNNQFFLL